MTAWFPFLSLRSHRETIAAKDETIALLRETVKQLTDSLEAFREASLHLRTPQPRAQRAHQERESAPSAPIDYAAIDPSNPASLFQAARAEMGPGKTSAPQIIRRAEQIKAQVVASRKAADLKAFTSINVEAPDDVEALIAKAIEEGASAAGGN